MGHRDLLVAHPYISTDRQPLLRYLTRSVCRQAATFKRRSRQFEVLLHISEHAIYRDLTRGG